MRASVTDRKLSRRELWQVLCTHVDDLISFVLFPMLCIRDMHNHQGEKANATKVIGTLGCSMQGTGPLIQERRIALWLSQKGERWA